MTIARRRFMLGLGALIGAPSWLAATPAAAEIRFGEELRHANGLRTAVPAGYSMDERPEGFIFRLTASTRSMNWIAVSRSATLPPMPVDEVIERGEDHVIVAGGGGSGGTEYLLRAWRASGGAFIVVTAVEQMELGTPTFDAGWAVFARSTLESG